jgi:hypothetical protein
MNSVQNILLDELSSRQVIAELKARYCRAVDRCDLTLLKSVFWNDATVQYGIFEGPASQFAELTVATLRQGCQSTMHMISNSIVELDGSEARSETYAVAYHSLPSADSIGELRFDPAMIESFRSQNATAPAGRCTFVVGARYLDGFARRKGHWRIAHRAYVWDWCDIGPANLLFEASASDTRLLIGRRDPSDHSYRTLGTRAAGVR